MYNNMSQGIVSSQILYWVINNIQVAFEEIIRLISKEFFKYIININIISNSFSFNNPLIHESRDLKLRKTCSAAILLSSNSNKY